MGCSAYYFAYGSNMHVGRLRARASSVEPIEAACLPDHTVRFNKRGRDDSGKCNVMMQSGGRVYGVVYRIASEQRSILDRAEGPGYIRKSLIVRGLTGGRSYRVFLYLAKALSIDDDLRPYDWYRQLVVTGAEQHGLPPAYISDLRYVPVCSDPNGRRSRAIFNIM